MKIVFFGTPDYVIPVLEKLSRVYNKPNQERQLVAVVTQPPSPVGREKKIERSPVDNWAYKHNIDVIFDFDDIPEADLAIVAAYGRIIPQDVLDLFPMGIINIHPSKLPEFRGASPIQATIATNTNPTAVSFIQMDALMDHGPILSSFKEEVSETDTFETLRTRLFERASEVLVEMIPAYLAGKIRLKDQDHDKATFTTLIKKDHGFIAPQFIKAALDGKISEEPMQIGFIKSTALQASLIKDYEQPATAHNIERLMRALTPWPGIWTYVSINGNQLRLKIHAAHVEEEKLVLDEVQLEGKDKVTWEQFQTGYKEATF